MNLLVTGGAGFIGSHVCERLLEHGHEVCSFDDLNPFYDVTVKRQNLAAAQAQGGDRFRFVHGDITDRAAVEALFAGRRIDQVIHLAALTGVRPSLKEPALYQRVNVEGTVNVLEAARQAGVGKAILASSSSVYGDSARVPFKESDPVFEVISPYAVSKLACEAIGRVYHHLYGLDIVILRLFTTYGPRQRPDLAIHKFARLIQAGRPVPFFGDGSTARDYTCVPDIVDGIMACTERKFGFEIFNLGASRAVTLQRLIDLLEDALGCHAILDRRPSQPGDVLITCADIEKAGAGLGYAPRVNIEEGIPLFVKWLRSAAPDEGR